MNMTIITFRKIIILNLQNFHDLLNKVNILNINFLQNLHYFNYIDWCSLALINVQGDILIHKIHLGLFV